jgi:hypothetical protein
VSDSIAPGRQLLDIAREVLLRDLVPLLPEDRRLDALMVAQAMAIAERESAAAGPALDAARLATEIRRGVYDAPGEAREQLRAELWRHVRDALRIANPKLLAAHGLE